MKEDTLLFVLWRSPGPIILLLIIFLAIIYNYYHGIGRTAPHSTLPSVFISAAVVVFIDVVAAMGIVLPPNESRTL